MDDESVPDNTVIELNADVTSKPVQEALKMISDATIIVPGTEEPVEVETDSKDEQNVGSVVKDLGEVSANEMKEIIEGAEVIVEEVVSEAVKNSEEAKDKQEVINKITTEKDDVISDVIKEECKGSPCSEDLIDSVELDDSVLDVGGEVSLTELADSVVESALKDIEVAISESSETASSFGKDNESEQTDTAIKEEALLEEKEQSKLENNEDADSKIKEVSDKKAVR